MTNTAAATYQVMDTDSASLLGSYASEQEALRAVVVAAEQHGSDSEAVLNLVLFREDGPEDQAFVAEGAALVRQALATIKPARRARGAPGDHSRNGPDRLASQHSKVARQQSKPGSEIRRPQSD